MRTKNKVRTSVSLDIELLDKAKKLVKSQKYRNLSHLIEYSIELLINTK